MIGDGTKNFWKYQLAVWLSIQNFYSHFTKVTRKCESFGRNVEASYFFFFFFSAICLGLGRKFIYPTSSLSLISGLNKLSFYYASTSVKYYFFLFIHSFSGVPMINYDRKSVDYLNFNDNRS